MTAVDEARAEVDPRDVAHIACDCVPNLGPEHCHLCSERAGHGVPWSECSSHSITDEQVDAAFASILETARDVTTKDDVRAALEAARGVQS